MIRNIDIWAIGLLLLAFIAISQVRRSEILCNGPARLIELSSTHLHSLTPECSLVKFHLLRD